MKTKYWMLIFAVVLALGVAALLLLGTPQEQAEIWSEGTLLRTVDLRQNQVFVVETAAGSNTITVQNGAIAVTEASCPDGICLGRGYCQSGTPIVCLPNQLVIRFVGGGETDTDAG